MSTVAELGQEVFLGLLGPPSCTNMHPGYWDVDNLSRFAEANAGFAASWCMTLENRVGNYRHEAPEHWRDFNARVLDGSGLDIVMLQDSVGAKPAVWQPDTVRSYALMRQQVCQQQERQFWMHLENIESTSEGGFQPCTPARLQARMDGCALVRHACACPPP